MAKKDHSDATWGEEMEKGWEPAMRSRLAFHGGLEVDWVARQTGRCQNTVRRWFKRLVEKGFATYQKPASPDAIRNAQQSRS
jgi:transposase